MRDLTTDLVTEKNVLHQTSPWIWLLEVEIDDSTSARVTSYQQNVTFDSNVYYAFPFQIGGLQQHSDGKLPTLSITIANVTREVQELLDANQGLVRKKVWVRLVHSDHLADPDAKLEDRFSILQAVATAEAVTFQLGRVDLLRLETPKRRYIRDYCTFVYTGDACGYVGDLPTCAKTLRRSNGCQEHGDDDVAEGRVNLHPKRYGGFPSILKERN